MAWTLSAGHLEARQWGAEHSRAGHLWAEHSRAEHLWDKAHGLDTCRIRLVGWAFVG